MTEVKLLLDVKEVAQLTGLSLSTIWREIRAGVIPTIRIGRRRLVPREFLENLVATSIVGGKDDKERG